MKFYALVFAAVGEFALTIIIFYYIGQYIDTKTGAHRYSTIVTVGGLAFAFIRVTLTSLKLLKDESKNDRP